jgi:hypothetical protein
MDDIALNALKASIEAWIGKAKEETPPRIGSSTCPLCQEYNNGRGGEDNACRGCPVYAKTGQTGCKGSPYDACIPVHNEWEHATYMYDRHSNPQSLLADVSAARLAWMPKALDEIIFLQSLLVEELERRNADKLSALLNTVPPPPISRVNMDAMQYQQPPILPLKKEPEVRHYTLEMPRLNVGETYTVTINRGE